MNSRLSKFATITTATFPVAYSYKVNDGFKNLQLNLGLFSDTAVALNNVIGCRVYIFQGQSPGVDDGKITNFDAKGHAPDYTIQGTKDLFVFFSGPMNIVLEFFKSPGFALTGTATLEFSINTW